MSSPKHLIMTSFGGYGVSPSKGATLTSYIILLMVTPIVAPVNCPATYAPSLFTDILFLLFLFKNTPKVTAVLKYPPVMGANIILAMYKHTNT